MSNLLHKCMLQKWNILTEIFVITGTIENGNDTIHSVQGARYKQAHLQDKEHWNELNQLY